jgi:hypothetical protein
MSPASASRPPRQSQPTLEARKSGHVPSHREATPGHRPHGPGDPGESDTNTNARGP